MKPFFRIPFRNRATEVTRLEAFSDVVIGFALTLIVVSLEVPQTFTEMIGQMRGFFGFAICFAILTWVWFSHYQFSRRYGLQDGYTIFLNSILLFLILCYVYPMKFLFYALTGGAKGVQAIQASDGRLLMMIYTLGFIGVFTLITLLFVHAYSQREELGLNAVEVHDTVTSILLHLGYVSVGIVSLLIAAFGPRNWSAVSGWIYGFIGPVSGIIGWRRGVKREKVEDEMLGLGTPPEMPGQPTPHDGEEDAHGGSADRGDERTVSV